MYESIFSLRCFSFIIKVLHISERSSRKEINSSLSEWPKNFSYLFILLIMNRVHLNLYAVSRKLKRKRKAHTKNGCFNMKYLKLMAKRFKRSFYLPSICYTLYWILQLLINPIHQSDIYLLTRPWLDKSYICNQTLRII